MRSSRSPARRGCVATRRQRTDAGASRASPATLSCLRRRSASSRPFRRSSRRARGARTPGNPRDTVTCMDPRIALVTSRDLPTLDVDDELLAAHLPGAEILAWEDESVTWSDFDLVILRSTWNYTEHLEEFLAWAERVASQTRLVNPLSVIRWNTDKRYLAALEQAGIPVVPTTYVAPGEEAPEHVLAGHIVVKPTVGAGSRGAGLIRDDVDAAAAHVRICLL